MRKINTEILNFDRMIPSLLLLTWAFFLSVKRYTVYIVGSVGISYRRFPDERALYHVERIVHSRSYGERARSIERPAKTQIQRRFPAEI